MTFTWDADGAQSDRWKVRTELQDTDSSDPLLQDEEIDYFLAAEGSVRGAAARAAEAIARKFARKVSFQADGTRVDHSGRAAQYQALAVSLRTNVESGISTVQSRMTDGYEPAGSTDDVADRDYRFIYDDDWRP